MNRQLKFRAWDGLRMSTNSIMFNNSSGQLVAPKTNNDPEIQIMQFTGLLDKNGVEIYEGDILCNDTYKTWEWRGVVKFSHGVFGVEWLANEKDQSMVGSFGQKHNLRRLDDDIIERQIVIGNIFENPELLNP